MLGSTLRRGTLAALALAAATSAMAAEYPIGKQQIEGGMEIGAVYLQPITMAPEGMMRKASDSDVHLEADIHAVKNNPTGFAEGDWMPYLQVTYELTKAGTDAIRQGRPDADGRERRPALRRQRQALRTGQVPPETAHRAAGRPGHMAFGRHIDKETGVGPWFKPFTIEYEFPFAGIGKKGGY